MNIVDNTPIMKTALHLLSHERDRDTCTINRPETPFFRKFSKTNKIHINDIILLTALYNGEVRIRSIEKDWNRS